MPAVHELSARAQAAAVAAGELSPVELVDHHLARVARLDATVGAFVTVTAERARAAARAAEQRAYEARRAGRTAALPPLLGVPTGIKDLAAEAGVPMKLGCAVFAEFVPDWDEVTTVLLRDAGAISLGKTNTPEFGLPCYTEPDPHIAPPARSPYDLTRTAGGSSGGAAAAVAAGLVALAPGSDGGGSIRIPASCCGLVGLKTSRGLIRTRPGGADGAALVVQGPLARDVADAALLLDVLTGTDPGRPGSYSRQAAQPPGPLRIGRYVGNILGAPVDPACVAAWDDATAALRELGHVVEDVEGWLPREVYGHFETVWRVGASAAPIEPADEGRLRPLTRWLRDGGRRVATLDYARALDALRTAARERVRSLAGYDAMLTPTLAQLPARVGALRNDDDPAADFDAQGRFTPYTSSFNLTGQPAVSVPTSWTEAGVPVGVQLVGTRNRDGALLALAAQLESVRPGRRGSPLA